jgi:hypothetical protein
MIRLVRPGHRPALVLTLPLAWVVATSACRSQHVVGEVVPADTDGAIDVPVASDAEGDGGASIDGTALMSPCEPFAPGSDLAVCTASYLGSAGADEAGNIAVAPDGSILLGATAAGANLGSVAKTLLSGGAGAVFRLSADGRKLLSVSRIGERVQDLAVEPGRGRIAVVGAPFGVAVLSPDAGEVVWQKPTDGAHVAIGSDGTVAVLDRAKAQVTLFGDDGSPRGTVALTGVMANDVAVHGPSRLVIITGEIFYAAAGVRQPLLQAFTYAGASRWKAYGWGENEVSNRRLTAGTRGVRVSVGLDGRVYYLGESHGGNTVHQRNPRRLDEAADNVVTDEFTFPYNTSAQVTYFARFRPENGAFERGQFLLTRERGGAPASGANVFAGAISADERGNVLIGGRLRCCFEDADKKTVRGLPAWGGSDTEGFALLVSSDFKTRWTWSSFGRGGGSEMTGVALRAGTAAVLGLQTGKTPMVTHEALQMTSAGGVSEAYFAIWSTP